MVLTGENSTSAALFIIIIVGAIRRGLVNTNHTRRLCWVPPWTRRCPIFGVFLTPLTDYQQKTLKDFGYFKNGHVSI
jgi:hypothetical protein